MTEQLQKTINKDSAEVEKEMEAIKWTKKNLFILKQNIEKEEALLAKRL